MAVKFLILFFLGILLVGCHSAPLSYKTQVGALNPEQFARDCFECQQIGDARAGGKKSLSRRFMDQCMQGKGYIKQ